MSCQVFSFGDAKVSKQKDVMLMLSFCLFSKEKLYLRSIKWGSARHGASFFLEVLGSRGLLKIFQKKHKIIDKMNKLIL